MLTSPMDEGIFLFLDEKDDINQYEYHFESHCTMQV